MSEKLVFVSLFLAVIAWTGTGSEESHPAEAVARELTRSIDYFALEAFVDSFSDDVTMLYPIASLAQRVDGREALVRIQGQVFDALGAQLREAGKPNPPISDSSRRT